MSICEYCHSNLPGDAAFCGACGRVQSAKLPSAHAPSSSISDFATALMTSNPEDFVVAPSDARTTLSASMADSDPLAGRNLRNMNRMNSAPSYPAIADMPTLHGEPYAQEDEDEEKRPVPLFSRIFPAAVDADLSMMQNPMWQAPSLQGVPDPGSAPVLSGTPQVDMAPTANYSPYAPNQHNPNLFAQQAPFEQVQQAFPSFPPVNTPYTPPAFPPHVDLPFPPVGVPYTPPPGTLPGSPPPSPFPGQPSPQPPPKAGGLPHGCALWAAILLIPLLLLLTIFGLSVTTFAPQLALSGTNSVNLGDTLHIHGHSFLANTTIMLTLDDNQAIQLAPQASLPGTTSPRSLHTPALLLSTLNFTQSAANTLKTSSNGAFNADIIVDTNWSPGRHILRAQEGLTPRSASLAFTILPQADALSPVGTVTPTQHPTSTPTLKPTAIAIATAGATTTVPTPGATTAPVPTAIPTPAPTPTPTVVSQLSSINPNTLSLGTLAQNSTQTLSGQTTLSATGNALVSWSSTWSQQASWLQVSPSSGQISTPGSQQIAITASAGTLQPGNYSTTISFSSPSNPQPLTLTVSFVVQSFCLTAKPTSLTFTGTAGGPDPVAQTFSLTNCGAAGSWTATASTTDGASWLQVTPASGTLANGASQTITVDTTITATQLAAGTYSGTILFSIGSSQLSVPVNLTVQAVIVQSPPTIKVTPTTLNAATNCAPPPATTTVTTTIVCQVTLTALNATQAITWTVTSNYVLTRFNPSTGTITTGQSVTVTITLYRLSPGSTVTVTFSGPNNTVPVTITN